MFLKTTVSRCGGGAGSDPSQPHRSSTVYVYFIWNDVVGALAVWAVVCLGSWKAARATDVQLLPALVLHVCRTLTGICQYRVRAWSLWSFSKDVDSQKPRP